METNGRNENRELEDVLDLLAKVRDRSIAQSIRLTNAVSLLRREETRESRNLELPQKGEKKRGGKLAYLKRKDVLSVLRRTHKALTAHEIADTLVKLGLGNTSMFKSRASLEAAIRSNLRTMGRIGLIEQVTEGMRQAGKGSKWWFAREK